MSQLMVRRSGIHLFAAGILLVLILTLYAAMPPTASAQEPTPDETAIPDILTWEPADFSLDSLTAARYTKNLASTDIKGSTLYAARTDRWGN